MRRTSGPPSSWKRTVRAMAANLARHPVDKRRPQGPLHRPRGTVIVGSGREAAPCTVPRPRTLIKRPASAGWRG
jgi:hypothetical protein